MTESTGPSGRAPELVLDAVDAPRVAQFWAAALHYDRRAAWPRDGLVF